MNRKPLRFQLPQMFLCLFAAAFFSAGCGRSEKKVIGVVPKGANHIFWQTVHAGAIKAAREFGFEVEWNAPTTEIDSSRQIQIVESMINRRLAGIALAPVDRKGLVRTVERASDSSIPVSIFDSAIDTDKYICYVATDNTEGGRIAARRLGEILGGKGKVAIIGFMPGSAATMEREQGFQDEVQRRFPNMQIVALQFGMADRAKAMAVTENILTAHTDLAGLFADNESSSSGAVQALKSRGDKSIKLVAFDSSEQLVADQREGYIDSLVVQDPFRMGYEAVAAIGRRINGQSTPRASNLPAKLIRAEDLVKPETIALLFPDLKPYLAGRAE
jgi:ribose transport system substrate-binding protein